MARLFVTGINLNKNELLNARIQNLSAAPSSPVLGQIYYDTSNNTMYYHNGLEAPNGPWMPMSGSTEVIQDVIGNSVSGGTGLTATYVDSTGITTLDLDNTTVTAGNYGTTAAKTASFTVDAQGRLTAAAEQNIQITTSQVTDLEEYIEDVVGDSLTGLVKEGEGIDVVYDDTAGTLTISGEDASTTNKGIASFNSDDFNTTNGHVELEDTVVKSVTTDSGALTPATHGISILGGEGIDVTHTSSTITVAGEDASSTNKGVASFDSTDFTVTTGNVVLNAERVEDIVSNLVVGGTGINATYNDGAGTLSIDIDSTVVTKDDQQTVTNKILGANVDLGANLDAATYKIVNLATPTDSGDAANKGYVDAVAEGLKTRPAVEAATTANLDATYLNGTNGVGATLTSNSDGAFPEIDGHGSWAVGDGILVKNQTAALQNGRYVITNLGSESTPWVLTRCGLCDEAYEIPGMYIFVQDGTINANTGWVATVADAATFVVGTDAIVFYQFSGAGTYTAGAGLNLNGTEFSVDVTPTSGNASLINTGGAVEVKTDTARGLSVNASGLGVNAGTGFTFDVGNGALVFASSYGVRKLAYAVGDDLATQFNLNHNLGTRDITVNVYQNASPFAQVEADVEHTDSNNITVKFAAAPTTDQYRIVVIG